MFFFTHDRYFSLKSENFSVFTVLMMEYLTIIFQSNFDDDFSTQIIGHVVLFHLRLKLRLVVLLNNEFISAIARKTLMQSKLRLKKIYRNERKMISRFKSSPRKA